MELLKKVNLDLQGASIRLVWALYSADRISEKDRRELIYRITAGDKKAYSELKGLLIEIAEEIGRI